MNWIKYTLSLTLMLGQVAFGAGRLQNEDFKSVAELTAKGSDQTHLLNDTKIYVTSGGINSTLASAISGGLIGGGGSVNYISKGDAETGTNVNTYKNTAQLLPVNGTGGSPTVNTLATTTSNPLTGTRSYVFTHSAASGYGEGFSTDFTIPVAQEGRTLTASFDYAISSGTYVGGSGQVGSESDIEVWAYDVTNSQLIPINGYKVTGSVTTVPNYQFVGTFQTNSNSTSYRLIFHNASTNASAWAMKVDNITVTPQAVAKGAVVTDWVSYPLVIGGTTTAPTPAGVTLNNAQWSRVGDKMLIQYQFRQNSSSGNNGSGSYLFPLPAGYTIDTTKIVQDTVNGNAAYVGYGQAYNSSPANLGISMQVSSATNSLIAQSQTGSNLSAVSSGNFGLGYSGTTSYTFQAVVPIVGWSSGQVLSSDAGNSGPVVANYGLTSSQAVAASSVIKFDTKSIDTTGSYSVSTGLFTAPVPGNYSVAATTYAGGTGTDIYLKINGVDSGYLFTSGATAASGSMVISLLAGQTVGVYSSNAVTFNGVQAHGDLSSVSIQKIGSGNQQLAASDTVAMRYTDTSGAAVGTSLALYKFVGGKTFDSSGTSYNSSTGIWTCPVPGKYRFNMHLTYNGVSQSSQSVAAIYYNGTLWSDSGNYQSSTFGYSSSHTDTLQCLSGDQISFWASNSLGTATSGSAINNYFTVERVGNY